MFQFLTRAINRRLVQRVLGCLWILDALLQMQPKMFTSQFGRRVLLPNANGQPWFISSPIHFAVRVILMHPALINSIFVLIQANIGILILNKRTIKLGLILSVAWGLAVWYLGEAMGGLFAGVGATLLMGAPGAALVYAVLSIAAYPRNESKKTGNLPLPAWLSLFWLILWGGGALLQLMNGANTGASMATGLNSMASSAPGLIAALNHFAAHLFSTSGSWLVALLAITQFLIGVGALAANHWRNLAAAAGITLAVIFWIFGQNFGQFYSGLATDPNTAPLLILLGLSMLGSKQLFKDGYGST